MRKVLVVDDHQGFREHVGSVLKDDYQVILAEDGIKALEILKNEEGIQLVLLDIVLPWGMDGIKVSKRIKEMKIDVEVVMMSALKDVETVVEAMKLGAMDYIESTFTDEELLCFIAETFDKLERKKGNA